MYPENVALSINNFNFSILETSKVGIQGGKGSFNEAALWQLAQKNSTCIKEVNYLYTTLGVFDALVAKDIDFGHFAIFNTLGGIVKETESILANYTYTVVSMHKIQVTHALMCHPTANMKGLKQIISHPQVFKQCSNYFSNLTDISLKEGEGSYADPAFCANALITGDLDPTCGVAGNPLLADIYGLSILEDNIQNSYDNYTTFLLVRL